MGSLIPNEVLIYEKAAGMIYARYRDAPYNTIPRWPVGGTPPTKPSFEEWVTIKKLAEENENIRKQLDRLIILYYAIKTTQEKTYESSNRPMAQGLCTQRTSPSEHDVLAQRFSSQTARQKCCMGIWSVQSQ